jgi:hypothetical protein
VIFLFVFVVLFPSMAGGLSFENFVISAYLCLLLGVFHSLPALLAAQTTGARPSRLNAPLTRVRTVGVTAVSQPVTKSMNFQS